MQRSAIRPDDFSKSYSRLEKKTLFFSSKKYVGYPSGKLTNRWLDYPLTFNRKYIFTHSGPIFQPAS